MGVVAAGLLEVAGPLLGLMAAQASVKIFGVLGAECIVGSGQSLYNLQARKSGVPSHGAIKIFTTSRYSRTGPSELRTSARSQARA